jgi:hypothetical protein
VSASGKFPALATAQFVFELREFRAMSRGVHFFGHHSKLVAMIAASPLLILPDVNQFVPNDVSEILIPAPFLVGFPREFHSKVRHLPGPAIDFPASLSSGSFELVADLDFYIR